MANPFSVKSLLNVNKPTVRRRGVKKSLGRPRKWCECWECRRRFRKGLRKCPHCGVTQ